MARFPGPIAEGRKPAGKGLSSSVALGNPAAPAQAGAAGFVDGQIRQKNTAWILQFAVCIPHIRDMSVSSEPITLEQMKAALGSLLFLWSGIERALIAGVRDLSTDELPKSAHGIRRLLRLWLALATADGEASHLHTERCDRLVADLSKTLDIRNLVCHGLIGISAEHGSGDRAACLTVELGESRRTLPWHELQEMFASMSRAPWQIAETTAAALLEKRELALSKPGQ